MERETLDLMEIQFDLGETDLAELQVFYNTIGQEALYMNHYELSERSGHSPIEWKKFLMDPRVSAFIAEELELLKKSKVAVMLRTVDSNKNTGQAQLLNTLLNQTKPENRREGPVFIYTQIPLNAQEQHARNVVSVNENNAS
jgi:hypothetical protein